MILVRRSFRSSCQSFRHDCCKYIKQTRIGYNDAVNKMLLPLLYTNNYIKIRPQFFICSRIHASTKIATRKFDRWNQNTWKRARARKHNHRWLSCFKIENTQIITLFQGNFDEFVMDVVKMRAFVMLVLAFDLISQELHHRLSSVHLQCSQIYWSRSNCAQFVCKMHLNEFEFSLSSGEKRSFCMSMAILCNHRFVT